MSKAPSGAPVTATCNLCGSGDIGLYHEQGWRRVVRCRRCQLVFVDPLPTPEQKAGIESEAYEGELLPEVADFFRNCHRDFHDDPVIESFRESLRAMGTLRRPGDLLDVGPGTGIFLHLARTEFGWTAHGIDICVASIEKARREFDLELKLGSFETHAWPEASFDAITMLDVLEHTLDPSASLRRAFQLLRPGGVLYVAVPNQRSLLTVILDVWIRLGGPFGKWFLEHLYVAPHEFYFCPRTLRAFLEKTGFEVRDLRGGNVYLGRYRLSLWMRIPTEIVLQVGGLLGMAPKLLALARKPEAKA